MIDKAFGNKRCIENLEYFLCITCHNYISKEKVPPMSAQNSLQLVDLNKYEELRLSELENSMIALNIESFQVTTFPLACYERQNNKYTYI